MLVSTKDDILEMNIIDQEMAYVIGVRRGGHIQAITGTECYRLGDADVLLSKLADDLKSGKWVLGTKDARPILKRAV